MYLQGSSGKSIRHGKKDDKKRKEEWLVIGSGKGDKRMWGTVRKKRNKIQRTGVLERKKEVREGGG
jgi:hypothetical protein